MRNWLKVLTALAVLAPPSAFAAKVTVTGAWIRALPGDAAGYFTMQNNGDKGVSLTGIVTSACGMAMLHKSDTGNGMASMNDVASVPLAPHETVTFAPG